MEPQLGRTHAQDLGRALREALEAVAEQAMRLRVQVVATVAAAVQMDVTQALVVAVDRTTEDPIRSIKLE